MRNILIQTALLIFFVRPLVSEIITSEQFGYSIDFPEGYEITDMEGDETAVILKNKYLDAYSLIRIWKNDTARTARGALERTLSRLGAAADYSECVWHRQKCAVASFSSSALLGTRASGVAAAVPLVQHGSFLTVLSYSPDDKEHDLEQLLISVIDSIIIGQAGYRMPGLVTELGFPRNSSEEITLKIGGRTIKTAVDAADSEAGQFVIDREFSIFSFYARNNLPEQFDAWVRFYRTVAKDSMERTKRAAFDIYRELKSVSEEKDAAHPDAAFAQMLLNWAQDFSYVRASSVPDKADLENIASILKNGTGDCDGRSLLLMCILRNCGIDSCMFISPQYSHALLGVCFPDKQGQTIAVESSGGKKEYLVGETTARNLTFGMMSASMQDRSKWIAVELP